jgi:hypothetical protein
MLFAPAVMRFAIVVCAENTCAFLHCRTHVPHHLQVALLSRFNGIGYTFVLAGFLKIVTVGGLTMSSPVDTARTAFGKASPYLMVPVGLGMCWVAKQVRRNSESTNAWSCYCSNHIDPQCCF